MKQGDRIQNGHQYGFFMIPNEMIDSHIENMGALGFVVYSVLMRHADASSQCFPSYNTLVKKSSLSRPTIAKCIEHLVSKGYIRKLEIGHSKGHATTYQLLDLSLVATSKPNDLVNEVNQLAPLTSKGDLPVTSKGGLPQLVNEVNSNNTHIKKPINNNTHTRTHENFEGQSLSDRVSKMQQAERDKWTSSEINCKALSKDKDFAEYIKTVYLPSVPEYRGKEIEITQAMTWIVKGQRDPARRDLVEIQLEAFEIWRSRQQKAKTATQNENNAKPRLLKPNPITWTDEQKTWSYDQWEKYLHEQNTSNTSIYANY
jgi:hypothetical protein